MAADRSRKFACLAAMALAVAVVPTLSCNEASKTLREEMKEKDWYRLRAEYVAKGPTAIGFLSDALKSHYTTVRCFAAEALGKIGDADGRLPLIRALKDRKWKVRRAAALALGDMRDASTIYQLCVVVNDKDPRVRAATAEALGMIGDKGAVQALQNLLKDEHWTVRLAAARALRKLGDTSEIAPLIAWAKGESEEVRQEAIFELGEAREKSAVPTLVELLKNPKWNVSELSARMLGEIGDPSAMPRLSALLTEDNVNVRAAATEALGKIGTSAAVPTLIAALNDWDVNVRLQAAKALGDIGDLRASQPLADLLEREGNPSVCVWAAASLYRMESPNALDYVTREIEHQDPLVRMSAVTAVGWLRHEESIPLIVPHLRDESHYVRLATVRALAAMPEASSREQLILALNESRPDVRRAAFEILHERYGSKIFDLLKAR